MKDKATSVTLVAGAVNEQAPGERVHFNVTDALQKLEMIRHALS